MEPHVTFHNVGSTAVAAVRERILTLHEGAPFEAGPGAIECRGVVAAAEHDEQARKLSVRIDAVPPIVTRGYVVGWLLDALVAAESEEEAKAASSAPGDGEEMGGRSS
jgi:hypothetical protein